jgi:hypothetical protein
LLVPHGVGNLIELGRLSGQTARRIVNHDLESTEVPDAVLDSIDHLSTIGHIGFQAERSTSPRNYHRGSFRARYASSHENDHIGSGTRQRQRNTPAYPAAGTGDQGCSAGE